MPLYRSGTADTADRLDADDGPRRQASLLSQLEQQVVGLHARVDHGPSPYRHGGIPLALAHSDRAVMLGDQDHEVSCRLSGSAAAGFPRACTRTEYHYLLTAVPESPDEPVLLDLSP